MRMKMKSEDLVPYRREKEDVELEKAKTDEIYKKLFIIQWAELLQDSERSMEIQIKKELDEYYADHRIHGMFDRFALGMEQMINVMDEDRERIEALFLRMKDNCDKILDFVEGDLAEQQVEEKVNLVKDVPEETIKKLKPYKLDDRDIFIYNEIDLQKFQGIEGYPEIGKKSTISNILKKLQKLGLIENRGNIGNPDWVTKL